MACDREQQILQNKRNLFEYNASFQLRPSSLSSTPSIAHTQLSRPMRLTTTPFSLTATNSSRSTTSPVAGVSDRYLGGVSEEGWETKESAEEEGGDAEDVDTIEGRWRNCDKGMLLVGIL